MWPEPIGSLKKTPTSATTHTHTHTHTHMHAHAPATQCWFETCNFGEILSFIYSRSDYLVLLCHRNIMELPSKMCNHLKKIAFEENSRANWAWHDPINVIHVCICMFVRVLESKGCRYLGMIIYRISKKFFSFHGRTWGIWKFPGQGSDWSCSFQPTPQPQHLGIQDASVIHTTAYAKDESLTLWARPGIKPASSQTTSQVLNLLSHSGNSQILTDVIIWKSRPLPCKAASCPVSAHHPNSIFCPFPILRISAMLTFFQLPEPTKVFMSWEPFLEAAGSSYANPSRFLATGPSSVTSALTCHSGNDFLS